MLMKHLVNWIVEFWLFKATIEHLQLFFFNVFSTTFRTWTEVLAQSPPTVRLQSPSRWPRENMELMDVEEGKSPQSVVPEPMKPELPQACWKTTSMAWKTDDSNLISRPDENHDDKH